MNRKSIFADISEGHDTTSETTPKENFKRGWLEENARNITKEVRAGKVDRAYGRELELVQLEITLAKRKKSNAVLLGEAGVGKTSVVEELGHVIEEEDYNGPLKGKTIYEIRIPDLMAGTRFRGDLEEKVKNMMQEASQRPDVVLFIDELHTIMAGAGNNNGGIDVANAMKTYLSNGSVSVIGATTLDEWEIIKRDKALMRRFNPILVTELPDAVILEIVCKSTLNLERHHGIQYTQPVLKKIPTLAREYSDVANPDASLDLADTLGAFKAASPVRWTQSKDARKTTMEDLIGVSSLMYNRTKKEIKTFLRNPKSEITV